MKRIYIETFIEDLNKNRQIEIEISILTLNKNLSVKEKYNKNCLKIS